MSFRINKTSWNEARKQEVRARTCPRALELRLALAFLLAGCLFAGGANAQTPGSQKTSGSVTSKRQPSSKARVSPEFKTTADQADKAREANQDDKATDLYQKALKLNPRWSEGWWYLGTLYYDGNQYPQGVIAFHNLVELMPTYGAAWAMLGLCEFETRDYKNALIHLQNGRDRGVGDHPELLNAARYHQALIDILFGNFEDAYNLLSALVMQNVLSNDVKLSMGLALLRVPLLPNQLDASKDALVSEAGDAGELEALGDYDEAKRAYERLIHENPSVPFVHYAYAVMLADLSQYKDAEQQLLEEIRINPESSMPYLQLAYVYVRVSRYAEAVTLAKKAEQLVPGAFAAHYLVGRAMLETGQVDDSILELQTAKRLAPYSPEVRYSLARALARAHRPREAAQEQAEFRRLSARVQQVKERLPAQPSPQPNGGGTAPPPGQGPPGAGPPQ